MALQQIRIGSATDIFQYDDAAFDSGIDCTAPISAAAPVNADEVLRLGDIGAAGPLVVGPGLSTDHAVVRWDGVGGFTLQDSSLIVSDAGALGIGTIPAHHIHSVHADTGVATATIFRMYHSFSGNHPGGGDISQYGHFFDISSTVVGTQVAGNRQFLFGTYIDTSIDTPGEAYVLSGLYVNTRHNHTTNLTTLRSLQIEARNTSTATISWRCEGAYITVSSDAAGTLVGAVGVDITVQNVGAGTINLAYGVYSYLRQTAGTFTLGYLFYGLYAGTIGTKWGIFLSGETMNYFSGRLGINMSSPTAMLHVDQSDNGGAIPVLSLDQADTSDGFINFIGSDRGVITEATDSVQSVRVEVNGVVRRVALYADA